jgi:hypothetical protein
MMARILCAEKYVLWVLMTRTERNVNIGAVA